jgi:hypothetical protein
MSLKFRPPIFAALFLFGFAQTPLLADEPSVKPKAVVVLADTDFQLGLLTNDRQGNQVALYWQPKTADPIWRVAQHQSKSNLTELVFQTIRPGRLLFRDERQWLAIHPENETAQFILGINADNEFGGKYRAAGDPWPHLYLEQRIGAPGGHLSEKAPVLAELDRVDFSISVRLLYDHGNHSDGYDPSIHAAQFLFFFAIQNLNPKSPGFGDYYWFTISIYDDRTPVTGLQAMHDGSSAKKPGTEKLIYDIGLKRFTGEVVGNGDWVELRGDLLPDILGGLSHAWQHGYLDASQDLSDYRIGSAVLGWEITGLNNAAMAVKNLRCVALIRPSP